MMAILVAAIEVAGIPVATASRIQQIAAMPTVGSTWICARFTGEDGAAHAGLKGRVVRVAHARDDDTPSVVDFKTSLSAAEFSVAYAVALKSVGWHIDPPSRP